MSTRKNLETLLHVNNVVIERNLDGVSDAESLRQPEPSGNCANWVLGHILATRNNIHRLLGDSPIWVDTDARRYERGSEAIRCEGAGVLGLSRMRDDLRASTARLQSALGRVTDEDLAKPSGEGTVGDELVILHFHEAYHAGQLGLLRRLGGKPPAIK